MKGNAVKRYEGLFILNLAGKEEGLKDAVDKLTAEINATGARVETVQKMDKKPFARVTDRKVPAGHYVNFIFEANPEVMPQLTTRFAHSDEVYRVLFSELTKPVDKKPKQP
jgi:small subunit ribosomal protein S6